ncbi:MAG: hypothetical protein ACR2QF_13955 [Geminicoccaceae bacterium]
MIAIPRKLSDLIIQSGIASNDDDIIERSLTIAGILAKHVREDRDGRHLIVMGENGMVRLDLEK